MKNLKPSMREKKRYLLIRGNVDKKRIEKVIFDFIGILGASKARIDVIKEEKDYAIICINRESVNKVRAAICIFPEKMYVERISGTLKGLKKK